MPVLTQNLKKMKKLLLVLAVGTFALASCTKEYTCECGWSDGSGSLSYTFEAKKADAEAVCGDYEYTVGDLSYNCELK